MSALRLSCATGPVGKEDGVLTTTSRRQMRPHHKPRDARSRGRRAGRRVFLQDGFGFRVGSLSDVKSSDDQRTNPGVLRRCPYRGVGLVEEGPRALVIPE